LNETLCRALIQARLTEEDVAAHLQVDPKTVRRWLEGRVPYLRHRWALAALVGLDETDLWPHLRRTRSRPDEVQAIYPHLDAVPEEVWLRLFGSAEREIGILADVPEPIAEHPRVLAALAERVASGVRVRICLIDLETAVAAQHWTVYAGSTALAANSHRALLSLASLRKEGQVEIRLHQAIVYSAIYYADDELLVSQHVHGIPPRRAPGLHLRRTPENGMTDAYLGSFGLAWARARPLG
jgi:transcriptional regulator with XRE-family HTH domain